MHDGPASLPLAQSVYHDVVRHMKPPFSASLPFPSLPHLTSISPKLILTFLFVHHFSLLSLIRHLVIPTDISPVRFAPTLQSYLRYPSLSSPCSLPSPPPLPDLPPDELLPPRLSFERPTTLATFPTLSPRRPRRSPTLPMLSRLYV